MSRLHVNFRAFLVVAVFATASVFCVYAYCTIKALGLALFCAVVSLSVALSVFFAVKWRRGLLKARYFAAAVMSLTVAVLSFALGANYFVRWNDNMVSGYGEVSGRVCCVGTKTGDYKIDLENLVVDGKRIDGKMRVSVSAADNNIAEVVDCGDRLNFRAYVSAVKLVDGDGSVNGWSYRSNIRFYASASGKDITVEFGSPTKLEKLLNGTRALLTSVMGDRYGNIAFSMLTGDKNALDEDIYDCYMAAGIGHIMAVSGLHIGFLAALLAFVTARLDKKAAFCIITVFLAAYCVIADFSPSVIRASVMAVIAMASVFFGGRRDILSSLFFAYSVILAVKPFYLFESGFLLSFGAIFGIALFANSFSRFLVKRGAKKKVADGVAASASVQIGMAPAQIYFFHGLRLFSVIVNIFVIPYLSIVYISVVCLLPIAAIPHLAPVLKVCEFLFIPLDYCITGLSGVLFSEITLYSTAAIFLCYPALFIMSEFFMAERGKASVIIASVFACAAFCFISPLASDGIGVALSSSAESVLSVGGKTYVIGYLHDGYAVRNLLVDMKCKRIDGIYVFSADRKSAENIIYLGEYFDIGEVYCESFDQSAVTLVNNGINVSMTADGDILPIFDGDGIVGYGYKNVLFASDVCERSLYVKFDIVRTKTVELSDPRGVYLCNVTEYGDESNVFSLDYGSYVYEL